jgi:bifunctional oligoribonuclease and PAP phosphatase NrnA
LSPGDIARVRDDVASLLARSQRIILTTHITPDADGLGSAVALLRSLTAMGKSAKLINCSTYPKEMNFLIRKGEFQLYDKVRHDKEIASADAIVATDIGGTKRLGRMEPAIRESKAVRVAIDHHLYENDIFDLPYIVTTASSSAELTCALLRQMRAPFPPDVAEPLYAGIVADTGSFAYEATTPHVHRLAAELIEAGARPPAVWRALHCQKAPLKMRVLGVLLAALESDPDGRVVWCKVDLEFLKKWGIEPRDSFEIVNYFLSIKGVEVGLFFMQLGSDKTKVSLRSAGKVDVCRIAHSHLGGGHRFAAGCTIDGVVFDQAIDNVLQVVRQEVAAVGVIAGVPGGSCK